MRKVVYTDERGRKYEYLMPDGARDEDIELGICNGPNDVVDNLGLPEEIGTRLHNQLFQRKIFTYNDARKRAQELQAALQAALRLDIQTLQSAFHGIEKESLNIEEV